ncbi:hypothetical protein [Streptomyces sp. NPDC088739]|uniref:hypothetical protein n=1 Tax=Streptomyces sp. NPDC088739 TaxID=3365882 RepID=UPI00381E8D2C
MAAVDLVPSGDDDEVLADVVELHVVHDEGAKCRPRLRALVDSVRGRIEAEGERHPDAAPLVIWETPRVRTYFAVRGSGRFVRVGTATMVGAVRKTRGKGGKAKAAGTEGAAPAKAGEKKIDSGKIMGGLGFGLFAVAFVGRNLDHVLLVMLIAVVIWLPVAWLVGGVVVAGERDAPEPQELVPEEPVDETPDEVPQDEVVADEVPQAEPVAEVPEAADVTPVTGETEEQQEDEDPEAVTVRVHSWVRAQILAGGTNGVHYRSLLNTVQKEPGGEAFTMPQLRSMLAAHGVPHKANVKAPAEDLGGRVVNRPGVHRSDLPERYVPVQTPGSALVRLLPAYQAPDQQ